MNPEIPKFVRLRGCINCGVSKHHKEKTGYDYGFHHELIVGCVLSGCVSYGHDLMTPFMDPEELVNIARKNGSRADMERAKKYVLLIKEKFGKFYEKIGVNLENLLQNLN